MRRTSLRALAAALRLFPLSVAAITLAFGSTGWALGLGGPVVHSLKVDGVLAMAGADDRDIIRLLPPSGGGTTDPQGSDIPFAPGHGGPMPGQSLKLDGKAIRLPIDYQANPAGDGAYIGVQLDGVDDAALAFALGLDSERGVFVIGASPGGPAAASGLRFGDIVTALDDTTVTNTAELIEAVKARAPGSSGTVTVWRVGDDGAGYLAELRKLADRGSTPAMMFLARLYSNGSGVAQDKTEAVGWYKRAALAGSTNGMLLYGDALALGIPVKDLTEALRWIRQAADAGNAAAVHRLGRMYRDGEGVTRDPLEAINLFKKAAEDNYTPAMVAVGLMFEGGGGLEANHMQAVEWYRKAANAGDADGMAALGTMYSTGRGVERNYATAATWYSEGSKRGQLLAVHNLAVLYDKGLGVERNPEAAADFVFYALERRYQWTYQQMLKNSRTWTRDFRKALQQRLAGGGYYSGSVDGAFGSSTFDAIKAMVQAR